MIEITKKLNCCGCHGCINICPRSCINMTVDNEGFWYPVVDKQKCIGCNLCEKVCPTINKLHKEPFDIKSYACKNNNEKVRLSSSSGGIYTNLCEYVISKKGVVFGATFNKNFEVIHMSAETIEECIKFRGSKYVQSKIGDTYKEAKRYLDEGRIVLFSGTQCQIKGLNLFLRKTYSNLIALDIICHGVPSPLVFDLYKEKLKIKYNSDIEYIGFREKDKGWKEFSYTTKFKNGEIYCKSLREDVYMKGFLKDLYLRPSCYSCKSKKFSNNSDISLADYWGVENKHPEIDDDKGISLVIVNTKKGQEIFSQISREIEFLDTDLEYAISQNPCIIKPVEYNSKREEFFDEINCSDIENIINRYVTPTFIDKIKKKISNIIIRIKR